MFRETAFKKGEVTLGTVVRDGGYSTGFIGKWHLGGDFRDLRAGGIYRAKDRHSDMTGDVDLTKFVGNGPRDWGFDYDFTLPCGIQGPNYTAYENNAWCVRSGRTPRPPGCRRARAGNEPGPMS